MSQATLLRSDERPATEILNGPGEALPSARLGRQETRDVLLGRPVRVIGTVACGVSSLGAVLLTAADARAATSGQVVTSLLVSAAGMLLFTTAGAAALPTLSDRRHARRAALGVMGLGAWCAGDLLVAAGNAGYGSSAQLFAGSVSTAVGMALLAAYSLAFASPAACPAWRRPWWTLIAVSWAVMAAGSAVAAAEAYAYPWRGLAEVSGILAAGGLVGVAGGLAGMARTAYHRPVWRPWVGAGALCAAVLAAGRLLQALFYVSNGSLRCLVSGDAIYGFGFVLLGTLLWRMGAGTRDAVRTVGAEPAC